MGTVQDVVSVNGLTFNDVAAWYRRIDVMEGWEETPALDLVLVANGGGPGALLGADPVQKERVLTIGGAWATDSVESAEAARRQLLALFPPGVEVPIDRRGRRMFVYLADAIAPDLQTPRGFRFTVPCLALDPFRYSLDPSTVTVGVFTGDDIWREYDAVTFSRTYDPATYSRTYLGTPSSATATVLNEGDADSRRVVIRVDGPLTRGDWRLVNETTGDEMFGDLDVPAGAYMTFDSLVQRATLNGDEATSYAYGDWLTLAPGSNTLRLISGTVNNQATMTVAAYSAWR